MKTWMTLPQKLDQSFTWTQLHRKMEYSPFRMTFRWNVKYLKWCGRSINSPVIRIQACTCLKNLSPMLRPCVIKKKWMRPKRGYGFSKLLLGFISDFSFFLWMRSRSPPCFKVLASNSDRVFECLLPVAFQTSETDTWVCYSAKSKVSSVTMNPPGNP